MPLNHAVKSYTLRDTDYYMALIPETIIEKLTVEEHKDLKSVISSALPKPSPKLIDFRFVINLIFVRYFYVLLIGKDRYKKRTGAHDLPAPHANHALIRATHRLMALLIFITINLLISSFIALLVYLTLNLLGIHLFSGRFSTALGC